jgi:hypothetical protein
MNTEQTAHETTTPGTAIAPNPLPAIGARCAETVRTMPRPLRLVSAGAVLCVVGGLMPWGYLHTDGTVEATSRSTGSTLLLVLLGAGIVWIATAIVGGAGTRGRLIGLAAMVAVTDFLAVGGWAMLSQLPKSASDTTGLSNALGIHDTATASPGFGLVLYAAGAIVVTVGTIWIGRAQRRAVSGQDAA